MKIFYYVLLTIVALLSIAAGIAKVMQTPKEVEFLQSFGLSAVFITIFGAVQIVGGLLLCYKKGRLQGAIIVGLGLLMSSALLFISGNVEFGMVSLLPIVLTAVIIKQTVKLSIENH
jgi:hypothetical protein